MYIIELFKSLDEVYNIMFWLFDKPYIIWETVTPTGACRVIENSMHNWIKSRNIIETWQNDVKYVNVAFSFKNKTDAIEFKLVWE